MSTLRAFSHEQIVLPSGLKLEVSLSLPPETLSSPLSKLAICLHPWSWLGGRMDDPVLHALKAPLSRAGYCVLRYNSRGVGQSTGWPSLTGTQEARDLEELASWAAAQLPGLTSLVIAGYSHGALVASLFPPPPPSSQVKVTHILLSYPLGPRAWLTAFRGRHYTAALDALARDPRANVLVVYGDHDEFTGAQSYDDWVEGLRRENDGEGKARLQILRIEGANHFWVDPDAREQMLRAVQQWIP
ncbi:alpha/beta hydrolase [Phanerochaete sordida]|uniref:Alpha/beta hydrolase n=1 Tax=Phanerochaete sordida TaxID=48140 RepID=A0A9P3GGM3_9APHY|nr:alpha/beta hydrolase [Phanerochaete sordida]